MFYGYFRPLHYICNMCGLPKPNINAEGKPMKINLWLKLWSLLVVIGLISTYLLSIGGKLNIDIKRNLEIFPDMNDLVANCIIIIINLFNSETICSNLKEIFDVIFSDLNFDRKVLKLFAFKMYFWFSTMMITFLILIILEIVLTHPPYTFLIRIPTFLSILHLIMHLFLILAILKIINQQLFGILMYNDKIPKMVSNENSGIGKILKYVFSSGIEFIEVNDVIQFDIKLLCKIYDNLSSCVHLLEKCHGLQVR